MNYCNTMIIDKSSMKHLILLTFFSILISACSKEPRFQTYHNPQIGLKLSYPSSWKTMKSETLVDAISVVEDKLDLSQKVIDESKNLAPFVVFSLAKPQNIDGEDRNPNFNVMVVTFSKEEAENMDINLMVQEQIAGLKELIPGVKVTENVFPLPNHPDIHNYSANISLANQEINQYQHVYWYPPYYVQIASTYSHEDDKKDLEAIINSISKPY